MLDLRNRRTCSSIVALIVGVLSLSGALPGSAQIPDEFTNLELLDPDIEKRELIATMRDWTLGLGVRCSHCHVGPDNLQGMDFATDEKAAKRTARRMLAMSREINGRLMSDLPISEDGGKIQVVSCYTCHRGAAKPARELVSVLTEVARESGAEAAVDEYRALRDEFEISGRYDFRSQSLDRLARSLAESGDFDGALAVLGGSREFFGESASLYANEGMLRFGKRDLDGARESFEKALELDPEFVPAKRSLERLDAMQKEAAEEGAEGPATPGQSNADGE